MISTRIPKDFGSNVTGYACEPVTGEGGQINLGIDNLLPRQAMKQNGNGGIQIDTTATDISDDPVFESNGAGGIQLKVT